MTDAVPARDSKEAPTETKSASAPAMLFCVVESCANIVIPIIPQIYI